jgi:regulator of protease activity HflC (stomatin/prohibitin superfamily)
MSDETEHTEVRKSVNESHDKIRLETAITRGTGTREQEKHKLKGRGETPEAAAEALSEVLAELEKRDVFTRARQVGDDE